MPDVTVNNETVTVALGSGEEFTPAAGLRIKATVIASSAGSVDFKANGTTVGEALETTDAAQPSAIELVLTNEITVIESDNESALINGFKL